MPRPVTHPRSARLRRRRRAGFTLAEMMVAMTLLAIVAGALIKLLAQQQRFYSSATEVIDARSQLRQATSLLPSDLRGVSSSGYDIYRTLRSDTSVTMLANFGSAVACGIDAANRRIDIPPTSAVANTYTSWFTKPVQYDSVMVYDEGAKRGSEDDRWLRFEIASVDSLGTYCPGSYLTTNDAASKLRYRITVKNPGIAIDSVGGTAATLTSIPTTVVVGAVLRFGRPVQYDLYQTTTDKNWYLGYRERRGGVWSTRQVVSGPYRGAPSGTTPGGLTFKYYKDDGNEVSAQYDTVARIDVTVRAIGSARRNAISNGSAKRFEDSIATRIAIRNRL